MKIRLQDLVNHCYERACDVCEYNKNGDCIARIDGYIPMEFMKYRSLCGSCPELAKALYTNEEIEL